jgi:hypothetical protein
MSINLSALMKQRYDTAANWTAQNPMLLAGEFGIESDTKRWKVGDGATAWTSLLYSNGGTYPLVNADIAAGAEIAVSKLADGSARQLLQTDAAGTGVEWASDISIPGVLAVTAGTAALPGIAVSGDTNTGIYSPGADQIGIATGGTSRIVVDASGNVNIDSGTFYVDAANNRVGIGTTSPQNPLVVSNGGAAGVEISATGFDSGPGLFSYNRSGAAYTQLALDSAFTLFAIAGTERARIDSSGRLLVGTATARSNFFNSTVSPLIQQEGVSGSSRFASITYGTNTEDEPIFILGKHRGASVGGTTVVNSGDGLGKISFQGSDGTEFVEGAAIRAEVDGTPGANDMPGRLVFSVTADGASSPTEALRIKNSRIINIANTPVYADNAAAKTGGLVDGDVYRKSDGTMMIVYT